jgi:hypothetical protein
MHARIGLRWAAVAVGMLVAGQALAGEEPIERLYEMRVVEASPGRLDALLSRCRDQEIELLARHGIEVLGVFVPPGDNAGRRIVGVLSHPGRAARDAAWKSLHEDPEWRKLLADSEKDGPLIANSTATLLRTTDYSPSFDAAKAAKPRVVELRTYRATPGNLAALNARFREHTVKLFEKHGMTNLVYWNLPADEPGADRVLVYLLAHDSEEAAKRSFAAFRQDPEWVAARTASEQRAGGSLTEKDGGVRSEFLVAVHAPLPPAGVSPPAARILDTTTILPAGQPYAGWPTLARRGDGTLWIVWSGGREAHVCPFGQVHAMTSRDDGRSWTWPRVLVDGPIDDRDAGVVETATGTLLATTFTSLAYEPILAKMPAGDPRAARWRAIHDRLDAEGRKGELGQWLLRSTDGGTTWSARLPTMVNSPHGPIVLRDGRLLYPGKRLYGGAGEIGVCESTDDGITWAWLAGIPTRPGDDASRDYHELHAVEAADGRIIVQIRKERGADNGTTLQSESSDGGRTWTQAAAIGVWGIPSHLLRLRDGRLLMTSGHRRPPLGNQVRISTDHGRSWSRPLVISADGRSGDLGYPSTVELGDGTLLTVWYEKVGDTSVLRQARWQLGH